MGKPRRGSSAAANPLWSSTLDHFVLESEDPGRLVDFYTSALQMAPTPLDGGDTLMAGAGRRLVVRAGTSERVPQFAFDVGGGNRLGALVAALERAGVGSEPARSPLLEDGAFAVIDPEGVRIALGQARALGSAPEGLPGRLQHIVFASAAPERLRAFYEGGLGFVLSDTVRREDDTETAAFFRSDHEHHSFAYFRADAARFDHFSLETSGWLDIRDWADHFAALEIPIWWGPGRHGPGNNLFFMIRDPDGNRIEISAECEHMPIDMPPRVWPHNERTLNLWGSSWMRS